MHGLVDFAPMSDWPMAISRLLNMSYAEREQLSSERAARFRAAFAPTKLLRDAGVDELLARRALMRPGCAGSAR